MTPEACESLISFFGSKYDYNKYQCLPRVGTESGIPRGRRNHPYLRVPGSYLRLVSFWGSAQDLRLQRLEFDSAGC